MWVMSPYIPIIPKPRRLAGLGTEAVSRQRLALSPLVYFDSR